MLYSPLRYPGGKNKLAQFLAQVCIDHKIDSHYVEPYAGWASVALYLLIEWHVERITINDLDRSIYAFWHCVLYETEKFCRKIQRTEITIENWRKQKEVQKKKGKAKLFDLGFSTFFLNRTNRSGILRAWAIWGLKQEWDYRIDCRFNKTELISRIRKIAECKDKITLCNLDAIELIHKMSQESNNSKTIFYFDPPYYIHGESLYVNHYIHKDHEEISNAIAKIDNIHWIVSYDNTPEIETIYNWVPEDRTIKYSFNHSAYKAREWKEIIFSSKNIILSAFDNPVKIRLAA